MFHLIVVKTCGADCGYFVAVREVQFGIEMIPVILPPSRFPGRPSQALLSFGRGRDSQNIDMPRAEQGPASCLLSQFPARPVVPTALLLPCKSQIPGLNM